jgi:uncharacterized membrane protein YccC
MLRRELAPTPLRLNLACRTATACVITLTVAFWLQSPMSDLAALFPIMLLSPAATCTWKNMIQRIVALIVFGVGSVFVVGVLVDMPWAMLPAGFAIVTVGMVVAPMIKRPIMWQSCLTVVATVMLLGTFHPYEITSIALNATGALLIAVIVCTILARLWSPQDPERTLTKQLHTALEDSRRQLNITLDDYCRGGEMTPPEYGYTPGLAASVMAIDNAAASTSHPRTISRIHAMVTVTQRVANTVHSLREAATVPLTDAMRAGLTPDLRSLQAKLNAAIDAYTYHAQRFSRDRMDTGTVERARAAWVDFSNDLAAINATWREVTRPFGGTAENARIRVNFSATIGMLHELASELMSPPEQAKASTMVELATEKEIERSPHRLPVTHAAVSAAMKGGLATMIAFTVVLASGHPGYLTATWTALLLVQTSYGAIVRKGVLRIIGGLWGGAMALVVMMTIFQSTTDPFAYLVATAVLCFIADYGGRSSPQVAYGFMQMGISYMICIAGLGPSANTDDPLERMMGIMIGLLATIFCYAVLARDYASNQLLRELAAMLKPTERLIPYKQRPMLGRQQVVDIERKRIMHTSNALRLVDEVVFEGKGGGVDTKAALRVTALARRVASHTCAIGYVRAETRFRAPPDRLGSALRAAQLGLHAWLTHVWELVDTTEKLGQPNSRRRRNGRPVVEALVRAPLPDLDSLLDELRDAHVACSGTVREWPPEEWDALAAEMVHVSRLVLVLPPLRKAMTAMLMPGSPEAEELKLLVARA